MTQTELPVNLEQSRQPYVIRLQKSLRKVDKQIWYYTESNFSFQQVLQLRKVISVNSEFLIKELVDYNAPAIITVPQYYSYIRLFDNMRFIRLLVRESLTNRIRKACETGELPDWLRVRIQECALAFWLCEIN